jgi:hypothetical protein
MTPLALLVAAATLAAAAPTNPAPGPPPAGGSSPAGAQAPMPSSEAALCAVLDEYAPRYRAAGMSEMKVASLRADRAKGLEEAVPGGSFEHWVATVEDLHPGFEGKAVLRVRLPCRGSLATWDSFFPDLFDKTQIPRDSDLFPAVERLKPGSTVAVSGTFLSSRDDGFREASTTERTGMTHPKFIVHFRSVAERSPP